MHDTCTETRRSAASGSRDIQLFLPSQGFPQISSYQVSRVLLLFSSLLCSDLSFLASTPRPQRLESSYHLSTQTGGHLYLLLQNITNTKNQHSAGSKGRLVASDRSCSILAGLVTSPLIHNVLASTLHRCRPPLFFAYPFNWRSCRRLLSASM